MSEQQPPTQAKRDRVFLVVVDDSPEREVALRYACWTNSLVTNWINWTYIINKPTVKINW